MFARHCTLPGNQNSPHLWMCRYRRDGPCNGRAANIPGDILSMHRYGVLATIRDVGMTDYNASIQRKPCQRRPIVDVYAFLKREPGDGPVHGTCIDIEI